MPLQGIPWATRVLYEKALREKIKKNCPNYGEETIQVVVDASMLGLEMRLNNDQMIVSLVRAIEIAAEHFDISKLEEHDVQGT